MPFTARPGSPAAQIILTSSWFLWDVTSTPIHGSDNKSSSHSERDPWVGKISWIREWLPIPVFLCGELHGQTRLVGLQRVKYWATKTLTFSETSHLPALYSYFDSSKCFQVESQWGQSVQFSTVAQLHPVLLQPHELQHARLTCPSPTPRTYSNSCISSRWCHPSIHPLPSSSLPAFNLSQPLDLFKWVTSSHQVTKVLEFQLQHQLFQWNSGPVSFRIDWLDLLLSKGLSRVFSNITVQKHQFFSAHLSL